MKRNKWRISRNKKDNVETKEQTALTTVDQEAEKVEDGQVDSSKIQSNAEDTVLEQNETAWRWNRKKKAWVEISMKSAEDGSPDDADDADMKNGDEYISSSSLAEPAYSIKNLMSSWKRSPIRGAALRVIGALSSSERIGESSKLLIRDAEVQAERIIALAEVRARELADRIVVQAEQRAEERVESIITRAEETALEKAINIIVSAEERAEALAEHIISRAEELAQAKAGHLISLVGDEKQQSMSVIPPAEEQPGAQAWQTIADTKEMQQQIRSATRKQAEQMLKRMADNEVKEITDDIAKEVKAGSGQTEPLLPEVEEDGGYTGTVELVVEPPVNYVIAKTVLKRMAKLQGIKVLDIGGSADKGVRIKLM
ncbi:MAG: hypothetical protein JSV02_08400 [Dehalococcoidia bacterium]|nr:MAG: hypothetical protein JSV02_08400 [Dehalococcoidia bacterium]